MAGIYIHIPFCAQKCNYCDFYSIIPQTRRVEFIKALRKEIFLRKDYFNNDKVETIYLGGGTPSILSIQELSKILEDINKYFKLSAEVELTIEANPENLPLEYLKGLIEIGFNRISIGIQSFNNKHLEFLKRNHNSRKAIEAIGNSYSIGFENISIDLIYGLPNLSLKEWESNLKTVFSLPVTHLSAYHLTYEDGTILNKKLKKGLFNPLVEEDSINQFKFLMEYTRMNNMPYYEISNFAKDNKYSKHNTSYWQQKYYLGLGPSAHSFNGTYREWNVSNISKYIDGIEKEQRDFQNEELSLKNIRNEYLITRLRTKWGIDKKVYIERFGIENFNRLNKKIETFSKENYTEESTTQILLTEKGLVISDYIIGNLFEL